MSQAFDHIVQELSLISQNEKSALREILNQELAVGGKNGTGASQLPAFGWAQGRVTISEDFDAPIEDFRDYTQ